MGRYCFSKAIQLIAFNGASEYYGHGQLFRESTGSNLKSAAISILKQREGEISHGRLPALKAEKTTFEELAALYLQDYQINGRKTLRRARELTDRLRDYFGQFRACRITSEHIRSYISRHQSEGVANGTINRELAALKRMFRLGSQLTPPLVISTPHIPHLQENNVRQGFFTEDEYKLLRAALPDHVKVPFIIGYWTGMRAGEIVTLRWEQIDLERGLLRLEPGMTKNREGRLVPLVKEITEALWKWKQQMLHRHPTCPWVCNFRGKRLERIPKNTWKTVCERVGLQGKLFHDLRRTAVRNMVRAGVSERVAMVISGHKTRSVFDRYYIVSAGDILDAKVRLERGREEGDETFNIEILAAPHMP
ncbi:MAG: tyrosine-type recombinase/integrase [Nitrospira sp.]